MSYLSPTWKDKKLLSLSLSLSQQLLLHINTPTLQIKIIVEMKNDVLYPL